MRAVLHLPFACILMGVSSAKIAWPRKAWRPIASAKGSNRAADLPTQSVRVERCRAFTSAFCLHLDWRVIGENCLAAIEVNPVALEYLALAIKRKVIGVLRDQHMGQQAWAWPAAQRQLFDGVQTLRGIGDNGAGRVGCGCVAPAQSECEHGLPVASRSTIWARQGGSVLPAGRGDTDGGCWRSGAGRTNPGRSNL